MVDRVLFRGGNTGNLRAEVEEREKYRTLVDFEGMIDTLYHEFFIWVSKRTVRTSLHS